MNVAIFAVYLIAVVINVIALRRVNLSRLMFFDGILFGLTYYLTLPMLVILAAGRVGPDFIPIADYLPYQDITTTLTIIGAIAGISLVRLAMPRRKDIAPVNAYPVGLLTFVMIALYLGTTITSFVAAGIGSGGHWFRASHELMEQNASFVVLKHVSNFARTAIFGCLAVIATRSPGKARLALAGGLALSVIDILLTFNRVTLVYFLVLAIVCFRRHALAACLGLAALLYSGTYASAIFADFRGQVSVYGYSPSGFASAIDQAVRNKGSGKDFVDEMNGVFESINIPVLNYIVQNQAALGVSTGAYFVRPLTVLLPRAVLPDRPPPFGLAIGQKITGSDSLALNSTLIGEPYGSSPLAWPAMLLIVLFFYQFAYGKMNRTGQAIGPIGAFIAFAMWRLDSSFAVISLMMTAFLHLLMLVATMGGRDLMRPSRRRAVRRPAPPHMPPPRPQPARAGRAGAALDRSEPTP